jgi:hypothetical protein
MRKRLLAHNRPSSGHESAKFAFILAKEKLVNPEMRTKSRKALQSEEEFSKKYHETKINVSKMRVRVIEIIEPTEQALFEIFVALN